MLQQILKDMYIDPDVLNALNEDQKKTLFLKMRQEQVRRWKEREEKLERDGGNQESKRAKPKTANSKNVSWLLGRDGDVAVLVIGEVDELKTSKIICSGFVEKKTPNLQISCHQESILKSTLVHRRAAEPARTERENLPPNTQPGVPLQLKGNCGEVSTLLPLQVSVSEHSSTPATEKPGLKSGAAAEEKSPPQPATCYRPHMRTSPAPIINIRAASAGPASANIRPGLANLRLATATPPAASSTAKIDSELTSATKASLHPQEASLHPQEASLHPQEASLQPQEASLQPQEAQKPQESHGVKDTRGVAEASRRPGAKEGVSGGGSVATCAGRGRVAQLMKTFSTESPAPATQTPPRSNNKPPIPSKPGHLRLITTPSVR